MSAELDAIEAAFGTDPLPVLRDRILALLPKLAPHAEARARALTDLGVVAHAEGSLPASAAHFELALDVDPRYEPALDNLAELLGGAGDALQALGLRRIAAHSRRGEPAAWLALAHAAAAAGAWTQARRAARAALALDPSLADAAALEARADAMVGGPPPATRRLLVAVDRFHPSSGGSERLAEDAAVALRELGWDVEIVTRALPERACATHRGLVVHEIDPLRAVPDLAEVVRRGGFEAILSFAAPSGWPILAPLVLPHPRPRVVVVPCVNGEGDAALRADRAGLRRYAALLDGADAVGHSSFAGLDRRLCADLAVDSVYVPNAVHRDEPEPGTRARIGLGADEPFLLVVGNQWPEKNHLGLLEHLREHDDDVRVVLVGGTSAEYPDLAPRIAAAAAADPRVLLAGPRARTEVAALMQSATALLLPSKVEATPLVVLEAMSHALPWIATPGCGAVHDHAGGLIVDLDRFMPTARGLLADAGARTALGAAGMAHWEACYSWERLGRRYDAILRAAPSLPPLEAPAEAREATRAVGRQLLSGARHASA